MPGLADRCLALTGHRLFSPIASASVADCFSPRFDSRSGKEISGKTYESGGWCSLTLPRFPWAEVSTFGGTRRGPYPARVHPSVPGRFVHRHTRHGGHDPEPPLPLVCFQHTEPRLPACSLFCLLGMCESVMCLLRMADWRVARNHTEMSAQAVAPAETRIERSTRSRLCQPRYRKRMWSARRPCRRRSRTDGSNSEFDRARKADGVMPIT